MSGFAILTILALRLPLSEPPEQLPLNLNRLSVSRNASDVDLALKELEAPSPQRIHINEPPVPTLRYRPRDMYEDCPDAMDLLVKTKQPVDDDLLKVARSNKRLPTRYRCAWVLIQRSNPAVVPVLDKMAVAPTAEERFLAWHAYQHALADRKLQAPECFDLAIARYGKEDNKEVRQKITYFFAHARAKAAVPVLIAALQAHPTDSDAVYALGGIGDERAVPVIIKAAAAVRGTCHGYHQALGAIPTAEAVQYLIDHLNEYGAVEALFHSGSKRALPELKRQIERLRPKAEPDGYDLAFARVAVIRLSSPDPREQLLQMAEDRKEGERARVDALYGLADYELAPLSTRLLKLYVGDPNNWVRLNCIRLLKEQKLNGVTEALIDHALALESDRDSWICRDDVLEALNYRLQTSFRRVSDLQAHLRSKKFAADR